MFPKPGYVLPLIAGLTLALLAWQWFGRSRTNSGPEFYLWVWQRSEDLSFIDPANTRLALWVASITLKDGKLLIEPRLNPVTYPQGTQLMAVVRLEVDKAYDAEMAQKLAQAMGSLVLPWKAGELQVDFDARLSQRDFYRELLTALHSELPEHELSITALASWCLGDPWIEDLPVAAAVPMLYRMGYETRHIRNYLSAEGHFPARICNENIGYSTDETVVAAPEVKRIFLYRPVAWDEASFTAFKNTILEGMDGYEKEGN